MNSNRSDISEDGLSIGPADLILFAAIAASLVALCVFRSSRRLMWSDELLGYGVLTAPSLRRILAGWYEGADGGGILYYLTGHAWFTLFHASALSLRLFSTAGFVPAMGLTWWTARRWYPVLPVAWATAMVYLSTPVSAWQSTNGRFYGLFVLSSTMVAVSFVRTASHDRLSRGELVFTAFAHAALIGSHILGLVYSAGFLVTAVGFDLLARHVRWRLYLAMLTGWLMLPVSLHAIRASTSIATNVFWTQPPALRDLAYSFFLYNRWIYIFVPCLAALVAGLRFFGGSRGFTLRPAWRRTPTTAVYLLLVAGGAAQLVLFVKSRSGISIYADRYLLPLSVGLVFLLADLLTRLLAAAQKHMRSVQRVALPLAILAIAASIRHAFVMQPYDIIYPRVGYAERLIGRLPPEKTVAVTFMPTFLFLRSYDPTRHYIFLLDWPYDLEPRRVKEDHTLQSLMQNWRRAGLAPDDILSCGEIFQRYRSLTLLTDPSRNEWIHDRLLEKTSLRLEAVASDAAWYPTQIWTATQDGDAPVCAH